jgi:hypothetical protein
MTDATPNNPGISTDSPNASIFGPKHATRFLVALMAVISCVIFAYSGNWLGWPRERGFNGSLTEPLAVGAFAAALVLLAVCAAVGTLVLSRRFFLGGLMTATAGLTVWAGKGGTMTYVLFAAEDTGIDHRVFLQLLGELVVLFGAVGGIWLLLWQRRPAFMLRPDEEKDAGRSAGAAIVAQAALMAAFILLLVYTPQKKQVLTGVFLAGLFSTAIAEYFFANRLAARWYWVGPLAVGALGYISGYMNPAGLSTGDLTGMFSALSRALPLDYASLGCAGVLVGYWWVFPDEDADPADEDEPASKAKASEK